MLRTMAWRRKRCVWGSLHEYIYNNEVILRKSTFYSELWWLLKRAVFIDLGISLKFLKKSLENIIVVRSYAGAKFAISLRSPVHGQQQPNT